MSTDFDLKLVLGEALESFESSSEEDSLLFEGLTASLLSNHRDLDEIHRLQDVHQGLVGLMSVAHHLPRASFEHLALFQISGNLATAGSDYSAATFFPSLESQYGQQVSTEAIGEVVQRLWQRIYTVLMNLIKAFGKFWDSVFDANARIRWAAQRMKMRANAMGGRSISENRVIIKREIDRLAVRGVLPSTGDDIHKGLVSAKGQLSTILDNYVGNVIVTGNSLNTALAAHTLVPQAYLEGVMQASRTLKLPFVASSLGCKEYKDVRFGNGEVVAAPPLLGNKSLFVTPYGEVSRDHPSLLAQAESARRVGVRLLDSDPSTTSGQHLDHSFATIPSSTVAKIADDIIDLTTEIDKFIKGSRRNQMQALYKKLLDTTNQAKNKIYGANVTEVDSKQYESAFRFCAAFATWSQYPHDGLVTHLLGVSRAALVVGSKSLINHR